MKRRAIHYSLFFALIVASAQGGGMAIAKEPKVKYAKTEVEKAAGKCLGSILGGALIGALGGRIIGGKKGTGTGALVGAAAGTAVCAIIMSNAKRQDRIIAAQLAAANYTNRPYRTQFEDDNGHPIQFSGSAGTSQQIDGARLMPARYKTEAGETIAAPVLDTGGQECRQVSSSLSGGGSTGALPIQMTCRTPDGNWQPYAMKTA